ISFLADPGETGDAKFLPGFQDEEARLNINALNSDNYLILRDLLMVLGVEKSAASTVAASVADWKDADNNPTAEPWGAEEEYYAKLDQSYHCKNLPFDSIEELSLVRGMTPEILRLLKPYITVIPKNGNLQIDFNTASIPVLKALARSVTGSKTNTDEEDADSLVRKISDFRNGPDGLPATDDDQPVEGEKLSLNQKESAIFQTINNYRVSQSRFFHLHIQGVAPGGITATTIDAVVDGATQVPLYWEEN
ncbi:MAG: general secretion pathway protein GspK, partial [Candidatus Omnitrophica bacterium]|nr:general secretion pathway protein GspK [Candidatus Omnitrophota bacterium]